MMSERFVMGEDVISSHMEREVKLESDDSGMSGPLGTKLAPQDGMSQYRVPTGDDISTGYPMDQPSNPGLPHVSRDTSTTSSEVDDCGDSGFSSDMLHQSRGVEKTFDASSHSEASYRADMTRDAYPGQQHYMEATDYGSVYGASRGMNRASIPGYAQDHHHQVQHHYHQQQQHQQHQHQHSDMSTVSTDGPVDSLLGGMSGGYHPQHQQQAPQQQQQGDMSMSMSSAMDSIRSRANIHLQQASARKQAALLNQPKIEGYIYQVHFKRSHKYYVLHPGVAHIKIQTGDYVKVEADRGEDLGVVGDLIPSEKFWAVKYASSISKMSLPSKNVLKCIVRMAYPKECRELIVKTNDEATVTQICREILQTTHPLPINIVDSEYQFDRKKLIIYHDSKTRVDFREFVKDLYGVFKTRIWMQQFDLSNSRRFAGGGAQGQGQGESDHSSGGWQDHGGQMVGNDYGGPGARTHGSHGANGGMPGRSAPMHSHQIHQQAPRAPYAPSPMENPYTSAQSKHVPRQGANPYVHAGLSYDDAGGDSSQGGYPVSDGSGHGGPPGFSAQPHGRGPPPVGRSAAASTAHTDQQQHYGQRGPTSLGWNPASGVGDIGPEADGVGGSAPPLDYTSMSSSTGFDQPPLSIFDGANIDSNGAPVGNDYGSNDHGFVDGYH